MRPLLPLVVALVATAGCLSSAPTPPPEADPDAATAPLRSILVDECTMILVFAPIPMDAARARVPEGFEPAAYAEGSGAAEGAAWGWTCAKTEGVDEPWNDLAVGILVTPPEAWAAEGAAFHAIILEGANDRADMAARYAEWNVSFAHADVLIQGEPDGAAPLRTMSADAALPSGAFGFDVQAAPESQGGEGVVRAFYARDGEVVGAYEYVWTPYTMFVGSATVRDGAEAWGAQSPLAGTGIIETGAGYGFELRPVALPPLPS